MKKDIHPEYFTEALVKCTCGNAFKVGSTKKEIHTEVCADCHPFYTGEVKVMDTAGRVEKFKAKKAQSATMPKKATKVKKAKKEE